MNKYIVIKNTILLIPIFFLMLLNVQAQENKSYEGYTLEIIKPASNTQSGQIRIYPEGRVKCLDCYIDLEYTEETTLYINGAKQKYSPFELTNLRFRYSDVLVYPDGMVSSINVYPVNQ